MPNFGLLQPGAAVMFQYGSWQGTSHTSFRTAIVGRKGINAETSLGQADDMREGWWMRAFDKEKYGRGESKVNFYLKERFGDGRIAHCSSVRFRRVSGSNLERKVMPNGELAVGPERFVLPTF